ncbi:hypothetical protein [Pseudomonas sp. RC10]|uniref:hypothetical protein n=1 Tax=Pseudomonas bambusae TaxID=3139142 RepID=UPI0031399A93
MNPANDTHWITRFDVKVSSNSNKVFGNGRHQLEVSVSLTPKAGVIISEEQLDSIRLVTLDDDGQYQELSGELQMSTERDKRFEYYADTGLAPSALLEANSRRRRFYVSSTRSGGSLDVVYASISKDDETQYVSHTSKFNSSVTLETLTPLRLNRDDFAFEDENNYEHTVNATSWDYDVYQLYLKGRNLRLVASIPYGPGSGNPYYQETIQDNGWFADGEPRSYTHLAFEVSDRRKFKAPTTDLSVHRRPGSMVFIRIMTFGPATLSGAQNATSRWGLLDQYGNEHTIEMTQASNGNLIDFIVI